MLVCLDVRGVANHADLRKKTGVRTHLHIGRESGSRKACLCRKCVYFGAAQCVAGPHAASLSAPPPTL